jgi:hypothetical protein
MMSSVFATTPGGVSGHILGGCIGDDTAAWETGYPIGAAGLSQEIDWFYGVKIPGIFTGVGATPYMSPSTPLISADDWRGDGLPSYSQITSEMSYNSVCSQWAVDITIHSTFSATIGSVSGTGPSTATLTLSGAATGPMWEGEVVGCATSRLPARSLREPISPGFSAEHGARPARPIALPTRPRFRSRPWRPRRRWRTRSITPPGPRSSPGR